jgi:multiple sugar transport system permease protein
MTGGGPGNATMIPSAYTLVQAYVNLDWGYAASLSVVLLAILLVLTALYMKVTKGVEEVGW